MIQKTIKVEVEITFEYDEAHPDFKWESYTDAAAQDMVINPADWKENEDASYITLKSVRTRSVGDWNEYSV